jgi:hypothetical protein
MPRKSERSTRGFGARGIVVRDRGLVAETSTLTKM